MIHPWLKAVDAEFSERLENGRLPHALLLHGPRHTGKAELANRFIASLLCLENRHPACGACRSCQLLASGAHPEGHCVTFEPIPKKNELRKEIVIDQIRNLIASLQLTNTFSKRKAALVHPAEAMNINAANALLKTLEEPPGEAVLILVSHNTARLPATIRSRCQNLHVRLPGTASALDWLCEAGGISRSEAEPALRGAAGSPLRALEMLREGWTDQYRLVTSTLDGIRRGVKSPGAAVTDLGGIEPELLWTWISLLAAWELKRSAGATATAKTLSKLQSRADENRKLVSSPVRKDFLLQEWLIQWSRLGT